MLSGDLDAGRGECVLGSICAHEYLTQLSLKVSPQLFHLGNLARARFSDSEHAPFLPPMSQDVPSLCLSVCGHLLQLESFSIPPYGTKWISRQLEKEDDLSPHLTGAWVRCGGTAGDVVCGYLLCGKS